MMNWINADKALPEDEDEVVLVIATGRAGNIRMINAVELGIYSEKDGWMLEGYVDRDAEIKVSHWMPIPEFPSGLDWSYNDG